MKIGVEKKEGFGCDCVVGFEGSVKLCERTGSVKFG